MHCFRSILLGVSGKSCLNFDVFLYLKVVLILANSADPYEMQHLCRNSSGPLLFYTVHVKGFSVYKV